MGYVAKNLIEGEELCVQTRLHWTIFIKAILSSLLSLLFLLYSLKVSVAGGGDIATVARNAGLLLLFISLLFAAGAAMKRQGTELAVTSRRVIAKFGFIRRTTIELNHSKVESIHVEQGIAGRIFGFGTLHINGTGGGITPVPNIADPLGFRRKAMEAIDASQRH